MKQIILGRLVPSRSTISAYGWPPTGTHTNVEAENQVRWPAPGTFRNLKVVVPAGLSAGYTRSVIFRKNGVAQALRVDITEPATSATDSTNEVTVAADDLVTLELDGSGNVGGTDDLRIYLEFESDEAGVSCYGLTYGSGGSGNSGSVTYNRPLRGGAGAWGTIESNASEIAGVAGAFTRYRVRLSAAPGAGKSYTFVLIKNGVVQDGSGGTANTTLAISDTDTEGAWTGSLLVSVLDKLKVRRTPAGTPTAAAASMGFKFVATTDGQFHLGGQPGGVSTGLTRYADVTQAWNATEGNVEMIGGPTDFRITGFAWDNVVSTSNLTLTVRKNAADTALAVTLTAQTINSDFADEITIADGDEVSVKYVAGTVSGGGAASAWTFAAAVGEEEEKEFDDNSSGETIGLSWVEIYHVNSSNVAEVFVDAPVDLNDPSTYYGGYKDPRVLGFGDVTRALSDQHGQYESSEFSWVVSDTDRRLRGWLGNLYQKFLLNRQVVIRMIDDASRRLLLRPRTLVRGVIRAYKPRSPLHFEFRAQDFLASLVGPASPSKQIPQESITRAQFPTCPTDAIGKPVPIIYGQIGDGVSATSPPEFTGDTSDGFYFDGGTYANLGFGPLPAAACSAPTNPSVVAAAGGTLPSDVPNGEWGAAVTAVDTNSVETDPVPFYFNINYSGTRGGFTGTPVPYAAVSGTQKITVSWTASTGSVSKYRVYYGYYYYGFRVQRYVEVTAPTTTVDITSDTQGSYSPNAQFWYYTVSAELGDGETSIRTPEAVGGVFYRRPIRVEWTAVGGATAYYVYRRGAGGTWDRKWTIPSTSTYYDDDLLDTNVEYINGLATIQGGLPVTYVGTEEDTFGGVWYAFLICGHQISEVTAVFQNGTLLDPGNYGVTFLVPGETGYGTYFPTHSGTPQYKAVNSRRYSIIYARGPQGLAASDGSQPLTINVIGRLNATNGTALTALTDIYKDFVINFGFQDSGGDHLTAPEWPEDLDARTYSQVDETSFDTVKEVHEYRVSGGYPGAIAFGAEGEFITLRDAIAQLNLSCDCDSGFNRNSQFFICIFDERQAVLTAAREYTQLHDIARASFDVDALTDSVENEVVYSYKRNYVRVTGQAAWDVEEQVLNDAQSIANLQETRRGQVLQLWAVRNAVVASDIVRRRLLYYKEPPFEVVLTTNLRGLSTELGDVIEVDHIEGLTTSGWANHPLRVMRHITNPSKYTVKLVCVDVQRLYNTLFAGTPVLALTNPTATVSAGSTTKSAGSQVLALSAPAATINQQVLAAGSQVVAVVAPPAVPV